jgi:hypothetical protein
MRISKTAKRIADNHIEARIHKSFTDSEVKSEAELIDKLQQGETFSSVMLEVELRYCSVGSCLLSGMMDYVSQSYKANIYKGFKQLIDRR